MLKGNKLMFLSLHQQPVCGHRPKLILNHIQLKINQDFGHVICGL